LFTSNINELNFLANIKKDNISTKNQEFLKEVKNSLDKDFKTDKTTSLSFENIKNISLEEIEYLFKDEENKQMAKNLRLATLFSNDENLSKAMFNTVLGKPFNMGFTFLSTKYEDKHNYFSSLNTNNSLSDLLHKSASYRINNENLKTTEQIPQEQLDEILLEINSFSFLDTLSSSYKNQYDTYKDKNSDYSFLYNDYYLQYEQLKQEYKNAQNQNTNFIKQF